MKILILSFFLLPFSFLFSQGNLQFNQVLTYNGSLTTSAIWTVPVGKVWKIESVLMVNMGGTSTFKVNNTTVLYNGLPSQPIWLKAGDYCQFSMSQAGNGYFLSIIEFNIIP